ncbi:MAG: hypothetical protein HY953_00145, partial [Candidatus Rokubacteria bacterium]|nr:hypothetical protein [Candidatus Rokubacteria bacterium]
LVATNAFSRYSSTASARGTGPAGNAPAGTEVAEGGLKSGQTTPTITKRMARIAAMMTTPESVTKRVASRSARVLRLAGRTAAALRTDAGGPPADALSGMEDTVPTLYSRSLASSSLSIFDGNGK